MIGIRNDFTLGAQNSLNSSQKALESSQERLGSGKRVNSAADDAAATAMISQFAARIVGSDQGVRNISDGVSLFQTAEAGVSQVNDAMERIRELSLQSLNGTLSDANRSSLQSEVGELRDQITQTLENTSFNGIQLLNQDSSLAIQAGGDTSDSMTVGTHDVQGRLSALGFDKIDISTAAGAAGALGVLDQSGDYLSGIQGEFGATQNRFESAMNTLQESNLNTVAARSRIEDTDYARESAQQAGNLMRQQANIAMQGQASSISSQFVTQLLGSV